MPLPIIHHPDCVHPLRPDQRFPMPKFGKVYSHSVIGGYDRDHERLARRHCLLYQAALDLFRDRRL